MTIHVLTNFNKKGCWILNTESHPSTDANKPYYGIEKSQLFSKK